MGGKLDKALAVLNGLVGDYLAKTDNGLVTQMACYRNGSPVPLTRAGLTRAYPCSTPRVAVFVHGVMCTEAIWSFPDGSDYGSELARELALTPIYVRYNTGLPIADNGAAFTALLTALVSAYPQPIEELFLVGYSMGGLVVRSACHFASLDGSAWLGLVRRAIYLATPHAGAPAERLGRVVAKLLETIPDPYTRLIADISNLRSAGVKDLGDADLRHEDRAEQGRRHSLRDARHPVPLLPSIRHYLIAGSLSMSPPMAALFGDSLVPVPSATAARMQAHKDVEIPPERVRVMPGLGHVDISHHPEVYAQIKAWCEERI